MGLDCSDTDYLAVTFTMQVDEVVGMGMHSMSACPFPSPESRL